MAISQKSTSTVMMISQKSTSTVMTIRKAQVLPWQSEKHKYCHGNQKSTNTVNAYINTYPRKYCAWLFSRTLHPLSCRHPFWPCDCVHPHRACLCSQVFVWIFTFHREREVRTDGLVCMCRRRCVQVLSLCCLLILLSSVKQLLQQLIWMVQK